MLICVLLSVRRFVSKKIVNIANMTSLFSEMTAQSIGLMRGRFVFWKGFSVPLREGVCYNEHNQRKDGNTGEEIDKEKQNTADCFFASGSDRRGNRRALPDESGFRGLVRQRTVSVLSQCDWPRDGDPAIFHI